MPSRLLRRVSNTSLDVLNFNKLDTNIFEWVTTKCSENCLSTSRNLLNANGMVIDSIIATVKLSILNSELFPLNCHRFKGLCFRLIVGNFPFQLLNSTHGTLTLRNLAIPNGNFETTFTKQYHTLCKASMDDKQTNSSIFLLSLVVFAISSMYFIISLGLFSAIAAVELWKMTNLKALNLIMQPSSDKTKIVRVVSLSFKIAHLSGLSISKPSSCKRHLGICVKEKYTTEQYVKCDLPHVFLTRFLESMTRISRNGQRSTRFPNFFPNCQTSSERKNINSQE